VSTIGIVVVCAAVIRAVVDSGIGVRGIIDSAANTPVIGTAVVVDASRVVDAAVVTWPDPSVTRYHCRWRDVGRGAIIHSVTGGECKGERAEKGDGEEVEE